MSSHDDQAEISRRSFMLSSGGMFTSLWVASQWPGIAAAAHHAEQLPVDLTPAHFEFFSAADGADVDAICAQIVKRMPCISSTVPWRLILRRWRLSFARV
jgi:hypothetical protein